MKRAEIKKRLENIIYSMPEVKELSIDDRWQYDELLYHIAIVTGQTEYPIIYMNRDDIELSTDAQIINDIREEMKVWDARMIMNGNYSLNGAKPTTENRTTARAS